MSKTPGQPLSDQEIFAAQGRTTGPLKTSQELSRVLRSSQELSRAFKTSQDLSRALKSSQDLPEARTHFFAQKPR